jgi:ABC-type transporter Mla MlaB component
MTDVARAQVEVVFSGPITIETVRPIKLCLLDHLESADTYLLHTAEVTQMDAGGAQLLHAFITEIAQRGATVRWTTVSKGLLVAARSLGMVDSLGLLGAVARR